MTVSLVLTLLPVGLLAVTVFCLVQSWLESLLALIDRLLAIRRVPIPRLAQYLSARKVEVAAESAPAGEPLGDSPLYHVPATMVGWMLVAAAGGLALSWSLFQFQPALRPVGAAAAVLPLVWRRWRIRQGETAIAVQVRTFLDDLRLSLAMDVAIGPSLERIAGELNSTANGVLTDRLRFHVARMSAYPGPLDVIRLLAVELRSRDLKDLVRRLEAARRGGESYRRALETAADDLIQRMNAQAEQAIEAAPIQLMLPMVALLFPPALVLVLYPLADRLINQVAGGGRGPF